MIVNWIRTNIISFTEKCLNLLTITWKLLPVPLFNFWSRKKGIEPSPTAPERIVKLQFKILPNLNYYVVLTTTPFPEMSLPEVGLEPTTTCLTGKSLKLLCAKFASHVGWYYVLYPTELLWHIGRRQDSNLWWRLVSIITSNLAVSVLCNTHLIIKPQSCHLTTTPIFN